MKAPFLKTDFARFGVPTISHDHHVKILDCSPWISPHLWPKLNHLVPADSPDYFAVHSFRDFLKQTKTLNQGYYIDYLEEDLWSLILRFLLKMKKMKRVYADSGPIPHSNRETRKFSMLFKIVRAIRERRFKTAVVNHWLTFLHRISENLGLSPDLAICSGTISKSKRIVRNAKTKLYAHSFDWDIFFANQNAKKIVSGNYAVFIDQAANSHPEVEHLGYHKSNLVGDEYFKSLCDFFAIFEKQTRLPVVIAAHPKSKYKPRDVLFGGREILYHKTAELVKYSKLVFDHTSTARSFAVLWKRPMIHLSCDIFVRNGIDVEVRYASKLLGTTYLNTDHLPVENFRKFDWFKIEMTAYQNYAEAYLKMPNTPKKPFWVIFSEFIQQRPTE